LIKKVVSKKKVLFLTSWYPSKVNPTLGNFVEKHALCATQVAKVTVLYATSSKSATELTFEEFVTDGVRTLIVYFPKTRSKIPVISNLLKTRNYLLALRKGYEKLNESFDLVHLNVTFPAGIFALELKRKFNIPYVLLAHWTGYLSHKGDYKQLPIWVKSVHKKVFTGASQVLTVSEHLGQSLRELGLINNYEVLPNVVSNTFFYPTTNKVNSQEDVLRIIHISSCDNEHKNIVGMLSAIKQLDREYSLQIVTESSKNHVEELMTQVDFPKERVEISVLLQPNEIGDALRKSDVFVLFSNYETFSVVLAEAWMSGVPAIYSKCGGLTELNNLDLGVQVSIKDENHLRNTLETFDKSNYSKEKIAAYASRFESTQLAEQLGLIYRNLTKVHKWSKSFD
jgi:glycosyltransferase involved in cell wall biosynthesis